MADEVISLTTNTVDCNGVDIGVSPAFTIIERYLRTSSDPDAATIELTRSLYDGTCLQAPYESLLRVDIYIERIFSELTSIALQLPWDHFWFERLALLLNALKKQPQPPTEVCAAFNERHNRPGEGFQWDNFPSFWFQLAEEWSYKNRFHLPNPKYPARGYYCWSPEEWLRMNKLIAVLLVEGVAVGDFFSWCAEEGLWVLESTLETKQDLVILENNIPSAVVWILTVGKLFFENTGLQVGRMYVKDESAVSLYTGPEGICDERWDFWRGRLMELAAQNDLSEETRGWTSKAVDYMGKLRERE